MLKKFDVRQHLNYLRINMGDFILCKKTYSKENGQDKELLQAGYWYALRQNQEGIYVSDGVNNYYVYRPDVDCSMFVSEHFLSNEVEDEALHLMNSIFVARPVAPSVKSKVAGALRSVVGDAGVNTIKSIIGKK